MDIIKCEKVFAGILFFFKWFEIKWKCFHTKGNQRNHWQIEKEELNRPVVG